MGNSVCFAARGSPQRLTHWHARCRFRERMGGHRSGDAAGSAAVAGLGGTDLHRVVAAALGLGPLGRYHLLRRSPPRNQRRHQQLALQDLVEHAGAHRLASLDRRRLGRIQLRLDAHRVPRSPDRVLRPHAQPRAPACRGTGHPRNAGDPRGAHVGALASAWRLARCRPRSRADRALLADDGDARALAQPARVPAVVPLLPLPHSLRARRLPENRLAGETCSWRRRRPGSEQSRPWCSRWSAP